MQYHLLSESVTIIMADIDAKIKAQGDKIRELKTAKSGKDVIEPEVKILLSLKADFKVCSCFILFWLFSPMTILQEPSKQNNIYFRLLQELTGNLV